MVNKNLHCLKSEEIEMIPNSLAIAGCNQLLKEIGYGGKKLERR